MAIDNPIDAFEQQYVKDEPTLPNKLAKYAVEVGFKLAIPDAGLAADILLKVADALFDKPSGMERVNTLFELISSEFRHVERTKASHHDVQKAIQLAIWYDRHERDDAKRERYVKLIGNAVRSEEQIQDIASFVQTLEQLNQRDITVLRVLNKVMNKQGDWKGQSNPAENPSVTNVMKVHPNTFIQRSQELALQVAMALGQATETNTFSPRRRVRRLQPPTGVRSGTRDRGSHPRAPAHELLLPAFDAGDTAVEAARRRCAELRQLFQGIDRPSRGCERSALWRAQSKVIIGASFILVFVLGASGHNLCQLLRPDSAPTYSPT